MVPNGVLELHPMRFSFAGESPRVSLEYCYRQRYDMTNLRWLHLLYETSACQFTSSIQASS